MTDHGSSCPLVAEHVVKRFHQGEHTVTALDQIDISVRSGEFVAIMGASGSGKSTLLHALAGLVGVDGGRVLIEGTDLASLSDAKLTRFRRDRIGLVFQSLNLIPSLTAEQNIRLPAFGSPETRVDALIDRLGLASRRRHKPNALSGGEQQRVAIARALVCDPAIVLADEPTGSLDSVAGQDLCLLLQELCQEQHCTIVVVTHEPAVAMWANRVVVLKDGRTLSEFPTSGNLHPHEITAAYQESLTPAIGSAR